MTDDVENGHAELRRMLESIYDRLTLQPLGVPDDLEAGRRIVALNSYAVADVIARLIDMTLVRPDNDRPIIDLNLAERLLAPCVRIGVRNR